MFHEEFLISQHIHDYAIFSFSDRMFTIVNDLTAGSQEIFILIKVNRICTTAAE